MTTTAPQTERPAFCLAISGGFFVRWRYTGRPETTFTLGKAKVFLDRKSLDEERARFKKKGMDASVVDVVVKIVER